MNQVELNIKMVERANVHTEAMLGMSKKAAMGYVQQIIDNTRSCSASIEADGVGMHVIKAIGDGGDAIKEIVMYPFSGEPPISISADSMM